MQKTQNLSSLPEIDSTAPAIGMCRPGESAAWEAFVRNHPQAGLYHLSGWRNVIEKAYNHPTYYLVATRKDSGLDDAEARLVGILPLVHLKHFLFGNTLVSMPYFDSAGILANDDITADLLLQAAIDLGHELKVKCIELRHAGHSGFHTPPFAEKSATGAIRLATRSHKVRMVLDLPGSSELLMDSFKAKLRSQIKKPIKQGLYAKIGGMELVDDFYRVFSENMRDLGSPVHSKFLIETVLEVFLGDARIVIVYKEDEPAACSVMIGFKNMLCNPWASALRRYSGLSPNMLLYWTMLEFACQQGFSHFDFGRSSPDEGTYKFKAQWGAQPQSLHWHYISLDGSADTSSMDKSQFSKMIEYWKKLPVSVTRIVGPMIRKHIGL
jgi:serine/alanine adding enzyme